MNLMEENSSNTKTLRDLMVGDEVCLNMTYHKTSIEKITKVTPTQIIVCGRRFNRDNGRLRSNDKWFVGRITVPTEEDYHGIKLAEKKTDLNDKLKKLQKMVPGLKEDDVDELLDIVDDLIKMLSCS